MLLPAHARTIAALATSGLLHAVLFAAKAAALPHAPAPVGATTEVEIEAPPPAPPEPQPDHDSPAAAESHAPTAAAPQAPRSAPRAAPPAAAGRTLTAPDSAPGQRSVEDFSLVQGDAPEYEGGATAADPAPRPSPALSAARPPAASPAPPASVRHAAVGPDLSRTARPASLDWDCSRLFPSTASAPDTATVVLSVSVASDGRPSGVRIQREPGHGFAAAAQACALSQRYVPALDREGNPVASATSPITIHFTR